MDLREIGFEDGRQMELAQVHDGRCRYGSFILFPLVLILFLLITVTTLIHNLNHK
jgi:hypothetical protein